jgi:hypothetical protein
MNYYDGAKDTPAISETFSKSARRTLTVDVAKYQEYLDHSDMTPAQKEDFLQAVLSIVVTFVDLGFEVRPLEEACGKDGETALPRPKAAFDRVGSKDQRKRKTLKKTGPSGGLEVE